MTVQAPLRFALVGCGRIAQVHAEQIANDGRGVVRWLCDPDRNAMAALQGRWPEQARADVTTDFGELLERHDIDAVVLCSPTTEHFVQAKASLQRGWHLLVEKPLATTRAEITELIELVEEGQSRGQVAAIGYQRRHWATYRTLRREVLSGRWGPVRAVACHVTEAWQPTIAGTWRADPARNPGGFVGDAGSHKLDLILHITNLKPREVFARTWSCGTPVEIVASISSVLGDQVPCTIDLIGNGQHLAEDLTIHCERADLLLRDNRLWRACDGQLNFIETNEPDSNPVSALLDTLWDGVDNLAPCHCALAVFDFTQAILASAQTGRSLSLS